MYFASSCKSLLSQVNYCKDSSLYRRLQGFNGERVCNDMVGGQSIVFTRKAVLDETFLWDSTNLCKSIVGIYASQPFPFSICQAMPTDICTSYRLVSDCGKIKLRQNKTRSFQNKVMSHSQRIRRQGKFGSTGRRKKLMHSVDHFCGHCNTVFEAMGCFYQNCLCQEVRAALTEEKIKKFREALKKESMTNYENNT